MLVCCYDLSVRMTAPPSHFPEPSLEASFLFEVLCFSIWLLGFVVVCF